MASPSTTERAVGPPPPALTAVVVLVAAEVALQLAALWSDRRVRPQASEDVIVLDLSDMRATTAGALLLSSMILVKVVFAARTRNRKAGSALALLAAESVGVLAALGADTWPPAVRIALVVNVVAVFVLVGSSLSTFPTPPIPTSHPTGELE